MMINFPGPGIYRGMEEENGMPKVGSSAKLLGVRVPPNPKPDVQPNANGLIPTLTQKNPQGMSCAPRIEDLPRHRRPVHWDGKQKSPTFQVWKIAEEDPDPDLAIVQDSPSHITIGPSGDMTADELQAALAATQSKWVLMEP